MNQPSRSPGFHPGNQALPDRTLRGSANTSPNFHDGRFTLIQNAVLAHAGDALASRRAFDDLNRSQRDAVLMFLQTL